MEDKQITEWNKTEIAAMRKKAVIEGLSPEELRQAVVTLRAGRISAAYASAGAKAKKKVKEVKKAATLEQLNLNLRQGLL